MPVYSGKHSQQSVFNVDSKMASQTDLISLHQDFEDIPIIDLKFIYKTLAGDYNRTVEFLQVHPPHSEKICPEKTQKSSQTD